MIQARSFTAEGAEFLAEVAEKNSLRVPSRKPLRTKDPTSFFEQDSKVKTSRRDETFIDKAAPEIRGAPEERNISKRSTFRSYGAAASWLCHSYKHSDSCGAFFGYIQRSLRRPSGALRSSAKTSASSAVKISWRDFI